MYINKENKSYIYGYTDKTKNVTVKQGSEKSKSTYKGGGGKVLKNIFLVYIILSVV